MTETCLNEIVKVLGAGSASLAVPDGDDLRWFGGTPDCTTPGPAVVERTRRALDDELKRDAEHRVRDAPATVVNGEDGGLYAVIHSPSGVTGALAVQARANGVPYSAEAARLVASLANLVGAFLEREQLQAVATKAAAEREADRLKSSLLSSVSHELKTPLAALTATVSNLLESDIDWDEQSVRDELRAIVGDVARLNNSIGALLDLSRLEAHAWQQRRELYELSDIIAAGIAALPAHLRQRVTVDLPDTAPVVDVDFSQWARVIQNLLENAVLYAGENTPVTIGGRAWNEGTRIWVEDLGPGIAPEEHDAVFEKFYRGQSTSGHAPSGTGLGLAITREIVRSHGGTIRVEDVVPHGARFVIALPSGPVAVAQTDAEEIA
jgi:two-component system sensor histidine kinase KdpD